MYDQAYKRIDDALWKDAGCGSELDYVEQSSWILFLKYLDNLEASREEEAELGEIADIKAGFAALQKEVYAA